jgi:hypothetical protein
MLLETLIDPAIVHWSVLGYLHRLGASGNRIATFGAMVEEQKHLGKLGFRKSQQTLY